MEAAIVVRIQTSRPSLDVNRMLRDSLHACTRPYTPFVTIAVDGIQLTERVDAGGSPTTHGASASSTVNGSPSPRAPGDNNRFSSNSEYTSHAVQAHVGPIPRTRACSARLAMA